ncbi:hypothetical protein Pyn_38026 [Prunus yedoensis var. nudiflora]|uniref:Uncharacterized protein n=1 Tax=Prunus yedoensis var. nudiflora TaxID=2094558 RepID=A0A314UZP6_PRUYE|nr:hypothetical protein Pyn_38026 [Prunus yedoensis var. nudiflora]
MPMVRTGVRCLGGVPFNAGEMMGVWEDGTLETFGVASIDGNEGKAPCVVIWVRIARRSDGEERGRWAIYVVS